MALLVCGVGEEVSHEEVFEGVAYTAAAQWEAGMSLLL